MGAALTRMQSKWCPQRVVLTAKSVSYNRRWLCACALMRDVFVLIATGYLPRAWAAHLAPLIDSNVLRIQGVVSNAFGHIAVYEECGIFAQGVCEL